MELDLTAIDLTNPVLAGGLAGGACSYIAEVIRDIRKWGGGKAFAVFVVLSILFVGVIVFREQLGAAWDVVIGSVAAIVGGERGHTLWKKSQKGSSTDDQTKLAGSGGTLGREPSDLGSSPG